MEREVILDTTSQYSKQRLWAVLKRLDGEWRITIVKHRKRRSDPQNRFYWSVPVRYFAEFLRAQGDTYTDHDAHEVMKAKFLRYSITDKKTGELIGESCRSTADLNTAEFTEYLEKCVAWLADMFGIICPMPNEVEFTSAGKAG